MSSENNQKEKRAKRYWLGGGAAALMVAGAGLFSSRSPDSPSSPAPTAHEDVTTPIPPTVEDLPAAVREVIPVNDPQPPPPTIVTAPPAPINIIGDVQRTKNIVALTIPAKVVKELSTKQETRKEPGSEGVWIRLYYKDQPFFSEDAMTALSKKGVDAIDVTIPDSEFGPITFSSAKGGIDLLDNGGSGHRIEDRAPLFKTHVSASSLSMRIMTVASILAQTNFSDKNYTIHSFIKKHPSVAHGISSGSSSVSENTVDFKIGDLPPGVGCTLTEITYHHRNNIAR